MTVEVPIGTETLIVGPQDVLVLKVPNVDARWVDDIQASIPNELRGRILVVAEDIQLALVQGGAPE